MEVWWLMVVWWYVPEPFLIVVGTVVREVVVERRDWRLMALGVVVVMVELYQSWTG